MAEACFNSKQLMNIRAFSSGIRAEESKSINGPVAWYAQRIIQKYGPTLFESFSPQITSKELLNKGDFTIFMKQEHYDFCKSNFGYSSNSFEIWGIRDLVDNDKITRSNEFDDDIRAIKISEETFGLIKEKVKALITKFDH